jgi:PEGA domain
MMTASFFLLAAAASPGIGVMDFAAQGGASNDLAGALSTVVTQELERLEVFRVANAQTTRVVLGVERQRQLLGCDTCTEANLADVTNYEYLLTGKVVKTSGQLTLFLTLIPLGGAKAANLADKSATTSVSASNDAKLLAEVGPTVLKLVGKLLQGRQGKAIFTSSELGAAVKVDDTQVGTTPLPSQMLASGPHLVSVEKNGFTASRKEVRVTADQVVEAHFTLVPSPDTITEYEARTGRTRVLAWSAVGLAAVGFGLFALGQLEADGFYGSPSAKGTFLYYQAALLQGMEQRDGVDQRAKAAELKSAVETWQIISLTSLAVGGAAAISAIVLFIVGEPPDKYGAFHAGLAVAPGLTAFSLTGRF